MAVAVHSPGTALAATVAGSLGTACSDVVVDSIVVERSRGAPQACRPPSCVGTALERQHSCPGSTDCPQGGSFEA